MQSRIFAEEGARGMQEHGSQEKGLPAGLRRMRPGNWEIADGKQGTAADRSGRHEEMRYSLACLAC